MRIKLPDDTIQAVPEGVLGKCIAQFMEDDIYSIDFSEDTGMKDYQPTITLSAWTKKADMRNLVDRFS